MLRVYIAFLLFFLAPCAAVAEQTCAATQSPGAAWQEIEDPTAAGWSKEGLDELWHHAESVGYAAGFVGYKGEQLSAFGAIDRPFNLRSGRKQVLNSLVGVLVDRGLLLLDWTLADLAIDDLEPLSDAEKSARVVDLLTSRSGVYLPAAYEPRSNAKRRPARGSHAPGTYFYYNNWDFNVMGAIVEKLFDSPVSQAFLKEIALPIGMQDYDPAINNYVFDTRTLYPAYLFRLSARDWARYGQLYLNRGCWGEMRVLSQEWVETSVAPHVTNANHIDFGYLWWSQGPVKSRGLQDRVWIGLGAGGQFLAIFPELDLIFVLLHGAELPVIARWRELTGTLPEEADAFGAIYKLLDARLP